MFAYILRRILLIFPTLFGILLINFIIVQFAPGGPVERAIAQIRGHDTDASARISGSDASDFGGKKAVAGSANASSYRGAQGIDPEIIKMLEKTYGFDKPAHERFWQMLVNYATFDFGKSYYRDETIIGLIKEKLPVSISLGLWTTLIVYLISIPLGIMKAVRDGGKFDVATSWIILIGYAIPSYLFAILLIILFAGGSYWSIFPMAGLTSDNFSELSLMGKITDYLWHMVLPITALVVGGFASLTMLTKNSFIDEIGKQYITTARAKGLTERQVLLGHVFRNAMLIIIAGFPALLIRILFTGALLIEIIFSLDGLGLLGYEALINRDYPLIFATLYIFTLIGLIFSIISDVMYHLVDPRIDFEKREI